VLFATGEDSAELVDRAGIAAKVELPMSPGSFAVGPGRAALWLSPRTWLIRCRVDDEAALVANLNEAFPDKLANAVPFTDALCWFDLSGPSALDYLTEGSFISLEPAGLPIGRAKRTLIAQIAAVVVLQSQSTWHIGVERSRAPYFVEWLTAAANSSL
jgi:heterotetrameric sarcosine oxidase gamma subunit